MELKIYFNSKYLLLSDCKSTNNSELTIACNNKSDVKSCIKMLETTNNSALYLYNESFEDLLTMVKSCFLYLEAAGGAVHNEQNEVLCMVRRNVWDLPKGKLDKGETPENAAVREVIEETGVKNIERKEYLCSTWHTYEHPKGKGPVLKQTYWYNMLGSIQDKLVPETDEDITEVSWVSKNDLQKVKNNTFPSIIDVLNCI